MKHFSLQNLFSKLCLRYAQIQVCMYVGLHIKWLLKLLNESGSGITAFHFILYYEISWESIPQVWTCFRCIDGQTELHIHFRVANMAKKYQWKEHSLCLITVYNRCHSLRALIKKLVVTKLGNNFPIFCGTQNLSTLV